MTEIDEKIHNCHIHYIVHLTLQNRLICFYTEDKIQVSQKPLMSEGRRKMYEIWTLELLHVIEVYADKEDRQQLKFELEIVDQFFFQGKHPGWCLLNSVAIIVEKVWK